MRRAAPAQISLFKPGRVRGVRLGRQITPLVDRAIVGDVVTMPDVKKRFIAARCAAETTVMLGCLTCRQPLATLQQLHYHLEVRPELRLVIARQCGEHGWEAL